jgi:hypothetical protein
MWPLSLLVGLWAILSACVVFVQKEMLVDCAFCVIMQ